MAEYKKAAPVQALARVSLALGLGFTFGAASAQTLIDTGASTSIMNTLNSAGGTNTKVLPQARERLENITAPRRAAEAALMQDDPFAEMGGTNGTAQQGAQAGAAQAQPAPELTAEQSTALQGAYQALERGQAAQARQAFEAVVAQNYRHPEAHFGLALALIAQGQTNAAKFELEQLSALAPDRFEGPYNLGVLAAQAGQHSAALAYFQQAATLVQQGSSSPRMRLEVLEALAGEQTRAGDYAALRQTLSEMLTLAPGDPALTLRLAQAQTLSGEGVAALPTTYDALNASGEPTPTATHAQAALLLSDIYEAQGLPDRALSELDRVLPTITDEQTRAQVTLRRAHLLDILGQTAAATTAAQEALRIHTQDDKAYAQLGDLQHRQGQTAAALQSYRRAASLQPQNAGYRTELSVLRLALGQYADARRDAEMVLKMNAEPVTVARAQLVLGLLDYRSQRYMDAVSNLQASAAALPDAETYLWLGLSDYQLGNYSGAAEALRESVRLSPTATAQRNLASALIASGNNADAESVLLTLTAEAPRDAEAWYLLGLAQRGAGKTAEARQSFQSASKLGSTAARSALR